MYDFIINTAIFGAIACLGAMGYWLFLYDTDLNKLIKIINSHYGEIEKKYILKNGDCEAYFKIEINNKITLKIMDTKPKKYYLNGVLITTKVGDVLEMAVWNHNYEFAKLIRETNDTKLEQSTKAVLKEIINGKFD
jgi:hypothetical protein